MKHKVPADLKKRLPPEATTLDRKAKERSKRRQAINKAIAGRSYTAERDSFTD